jgi:hypothetical protein
VLIPAAQERRTHLRRRGRAFLIAVVAMVVTVLVASWLVGTTSDNERQQSGVLAGSSGSPSAPSPPTSRTTVLIGYDGEVHVVTNLLYDAPQSEVVLQVAQPTGTGFAFDPDVEVVGLDTDGRTQLLDGPVTVGDAVPLPLDPPAEEVRLEYVATGTYAASELSTTGRGLVLLTPLTVLESGLRSQVKVTDPRILNLGCADTAQMSACGSLSGARWTARRLAPDEVVVAQVDLVATGP